MKNILRMLVNSVGEKYMTVKVSEETGIFLEDLVQFARDKTRKNISINIFLVRNNTHGTASGSSFVHQLFINAVRPAFYGMIFLYLNSGRETHYSDVIMTMMASQITSLTIVYSTVYSSADQRKHQSPASVAFVRGIHREPVNSPHKWPVTRKMFPFDDVIMKWNVGNLYEHGKMARFVDASSITIQIRLNDVSLISPRIELRDLYKFLHMTR